MHNEGSNASVVVGPEEWQRQHTSAAIPLIGTCVPLVNMQQPRTFYNMIYGCCLPTTTLIVGLLLLLPLCTQSHWHVHTHACATGVEAEMNPKPEYIKEDYKVWCRTMCSTASLVYPIWYASSTTYRFQNLHSASCHSSVPANVLFSLLVHIHCMLKCQPTTC
jgi:hypothetical protein